MDAAWLCVCVWCVWCLCMCCECMDAAWLRVGVSVCGVCLCVVCVCVLRMYGCGVVVFRCVCVWYVLQCIAVCCSVALASHSTTATHNCHSRVSLQHVYGHVLQCVCCSVCVAVCVLQDSLSHSISSKCRGTVVCVAKRALHIAKRDVVNQMSCYCRVHCQKSPVHCQKRPVHCQKSPVPFQKSPTCSHFMYSQSHSDIMLRITCHVHVHTLLQCVAVCCSVMFT